MSLVQNSTGAFWNRNQNPTKLYEKIIGSEGLSFEGVFWLKDFKDIYLIAEKINAKNDKHPRIQSIYRLEDYKQLTLIV